MSTGIQKKSRVQSRLDPRSSPSPRKSRVKTRTKSRAFPKRVRTPKKSRIQTRMVGGQMVRVHCTSKVDSPKKWRQSPNRMENSPKKSRVQTIINARAAPKSVRRSVQSAKTLYESNARIKRIKLPSNSPANSPEISWRIVPKSLDRKEINDKSKQRRISRHRKPCNSSLPPVTPSHRDAPRSRSSGIAPVMKEVRETSPAQRNQILDAFKSCSSSQSTLITLLQASTESRTQPNGESNEVRTKRKPCTISVLKERLLKVDQGVGELRQDNTDKSHRLDFLEWETMKLFKQLDKKTSQNLSLESKNNAIRPRAMTSSLERDVRREMRENQLEWERVFENKNLQPDYGHHTWTRKDEEENQPEVLTAEDDVFL